MDRNREANQEDIIFDEVVDHLGAIKISRREMTLEYDGQTLFLKLDHGAGVVETRSNGQLLSGPHPFRGLDAIFLDQAGICLFLFRPASGWVSRLYVYKTAYYRLEGPRKDEEQ